MKRLPIADLHLGIALHTVGHPLRTKVLRSEESAPQISAWVDHDLPAATRLVGRWETGHLARTEPRHALLAAFAGIECLESLEKWLRDPSINPRFTVLPPPDLAPYLPAAAVDVFALRTTDDLATAAALIACGFLGPEVLQNSGDGKHAALPLLSVSRTEPLLSREVAGTLTGFACVHPLAYALYGAKNWISFRVKSDPTLAKKFTILLRGSGTRSAVVSRDLIDNTRPFIEIALPNGQTRKVQNRFRDQMRNHLRGLAAS